MKNATQQSQVLDQREAVSWRNKAVQHLDYIESKFSQKACIQVTVTATTSSVTVYVKFYLPMKKNSHVVE